MRASGRLLTDAFAVPRGERGVTLLLFAWYFLTICAYYVIRPVRSSLVLTDYGPGALPWVYMGTALATGAAVWVYSRFADLPRRKLIGATLLVFVLNLFAWWRIAGGAEAARRAGTGGWAWASPAFYVWTDVFSIMAVTIFWMYANDVFSPESAKRVFGLISAAGPAGGIAGAWLTERLVPRAGTVNMVLVAAGVYLAALGIFLALERLTGGRSSRRGPAADRPPGADLSELSAVLRWIGSSRFLLLLTLLVCLERMVPDFVDFVFQSVAKTAFPEQDPYTRFFAGFEKWRSVAALAGSLLLTGPILSFAGVTAALVSVPATILAMGTAFLASPTLPAAVLLKGLEEGQRHSWFKAGKEVAYTVTDHDVIYRAKGYIEMFVYRFARGLAGLAILLVTAAAGPGISAVAAAALPLALVWIGCAWGLGREYQALERRG